MIHHQKTKSFPELRKAQFQTAGGSAAVDGSTDLTPGTRLGRYVVLYRIGSGGMGVVYAAYDPELDRKVALKLLTRQLDPTQAEALTRREAQAMARLAHPNVVTVHDVYSYDDRVFIAMEHLEGQTLKRWLAAETRSWRSVLEVFLQAGRGLAAAHGVDLVHLDFKPGNVMLTEDGGVRVLDFGLAQLDLGSGSEDPGTLAKIGEASDTVTDDTLRWIATHRDTIRGTPAYLAPERLLTGSADARSDQFSFCVALYEALYGERPFAGESLEEVLAQVRRGVIREPAARRVPGWLRKALLRGLSPEPDDRFENMDALLRTLSPEPRRVRRRRLAAGFGAVILGAFLAGYWAILPDPIPVCAGATERLVGVWDAERKQAVRTAFVRTGKALAEQALESVAKSVEGKNRGWDRQGVEAAFAGTTKTFAERTLGRVIEAMDRYTQDWVEQHTEACEATHVHGEQSERMLDLRMMCLDWRLDEVRAMATVLTEVDARAMATAPETVSSLGDLEACNDRVELMSWQLPPGATEARQAIEELRADVLMTARRWQSARSVELDVMRRNVDRARQIDYPRLEANALTVLGEGQLYISGETSAAEETYRQALLAAMKAGDRVLQARIYGSLVRVIGYFKGRTEEAQWWGNAAKAMLSALGPSHDLERLEVMESLAVAAYSSDEKVAGERLMIQVLEIAERLWEDEDPRLVSKLNNLAIFMGLDRLEEKIRILERALAIVEKTVAPGNPIYLGPSLTNLSQAYQDAGRYEEALAMSTRCLKVIEEFYGEHRDLTYPLINTAQLLNYAQDQPVEAERHLRRAMPLTDVGFGPKHPLMGYVLNILGDTLVRQQRYDEAEPFLRQALALREEKFPAGHPDRAASYSSLGTLLLAQREPTQALEQLKRALAEVDEEAPQDLRVYTAIVVRMGEAFLDLGQTARARSSFEKALAMEWAERFPQLRSQARFALARTLGPEERGRALELTNQALQELAGSSPRTASQRQQMESWLRHQASGAVS